LDINTYKIEKSFNFERRKNLNTFAFISDDKAAYGFNNAIRLFSLNDDWELDLLHSYGSSINCLLLLKDGILVSCASGELNEIKIWDINKN
jgi:hypothetical protein